MEDFFEDAASKLEKIGEFFQVSIHFHLSIRSDRGQETVSVPSNSLDL